MTNQDLQVLVENALGWEPSVDAGDIGVATDDGIVTLRGKVGSYAEKLAAERAALRVFGVKAVANDLTVHITGAFERNDTDLAQAAVAALKWHTFIPAGRITVAVADGWITLKGTVDWQYQKDAAARAVRELTGVKGVNNDIALKPQVKTTDVREKIEAAFKRSAELDARRINVNATDGTVVLSGHVRSWAERQEAAHAAWAAPGVNTVDDRLTIVP
jgi:osmotically-inducible protein OsmY